MLLIKSLDQSGEAERGMIIWISTFPAVARSATQSTQHQALCNSERIPHVSYGIFRNRGGVCTRESSLILVDQGRPVVEAQATIFLEEKHRFGPAVSSVLSNLAANYDLTRPMSKCVGHLLFYGQDAELAEETRGVLRSA